MRFLLLHYTSKNEKKGHECCQKKKKKKPQEGSSRKKIKRLKKMHATTIQKNKKSKRSLDKDVILGSYITNFEVE